MQPSSSKLNRFLAISVIFLTLCSIFSVAGVIYLNSRINTANADVSEEISNLSSSIVSLQTSIATTNNNLSMALVHITEIESRLGGFQNQVGSLSGTLNNIQKLAGIDPELLKKYSKVYFLNENFVPKQLTLIPQQYDYSDVKQSLIVTQVLPHLEQMIDTASSSGVTIYVDSAYRSFAEQKALKTIYKVTYGAGTANSFSADQGYSEHQLGTAVDLITSGLGGALDDRFDNTSAYKWLLSNAYKYGFVLSYPANNNYYVFEPWHWRYVGVKLATDLHNQGKNFYDVDQRTLDTYLINIFD